MPIITITALDLTFQPGVKQVFWMRWARADAPGTYYTLPNIKVDPFGNVIGGPYTFEVPHTDIVVEARNENKCEDWFAKTFSICDLVEVTTDITP